MRHLYRGFLLTGLLVVLGVANYDIISKQKIVNEGREVLLKLRPVDPRSLIQGDYMILRYDKAAFPAKDVMEDLPYSGLIVITVDANNLASYARIDDGEVLGENEVYLRFRQRLKTGELRYGAESFFFQEGQADRFSKAKYGILHIDASGKSILVGLADEAFTKIPYNEKVVDGG
ncbi:MAG: GDYXXLXY domain-containing protein [Hyphomicrobiales bacterium]|nr:GDYXXLXY domain-containing protein [Hyphomicrobiales bacterium]